MQDAMVAAVVRAIRTIKELNEEPLTVELTPETAIYGAGAALDSKDMMELVIRLEQETSVNLLDERPLDESMIRNIGALARAYAEVVASKGASR